MSVLQTCQEGFDLMLVVDHEIAPDASRIASFSNGAEVYIAREEGARRWSDAYKNLDVLDMPASGPLYLVDARDEIDHHHYVAEFREEIGIRAVRFTTHLQNPATLARAMKPVVNALVAGQRIVFFCKHGRHRSFQLALWLLAPFFDEFEVLVAFVAMRRICVQAKNLPGHHLSIL